MLDTETNDVTPVEGEVLPPESSEPSYSQQRLVIHQREALFTPIDLGVTNTPYPTVSAIEEEAGEEPTYTFRGKFWDVFRDVFNIACQRIHINNREKGFWPNNVKPDGTPDEKGKLRLALYEDTHGRNVGEAIALMTSEGSEGLDAYRSGGLEHPDDKLPHRSGLFTELADKVIRAMDFLGGVMAEGGTIIVEKVTFNKDQRGHLHGRRF
jgi:hypothetical protein